MASMLVVSFAVTRSLVVVSPLPKRVNPARCDFYVMFGRLAGSRKQHSPMRYAFQAAGVFFSRYWGNMGGRHRCGGWAIQGQFGCHSSAPNALHIDLRRWWPRPEPRLVAKCCAGVLCMWYIFCFPCCSDLADRRALVMEKMSAQVEMSANQINIEIVCGSIFPGPQQRKFLLSLAPPPGGVRTSRLEIRSLCVFPSGFGVRFDGFISSSPQQPSTAYNQALLKPSGRAAQLRERPRSITQSGTASGVRQMHL